MPFPESVRVKYEVFLTSSDADATFVVSSPRLAGTLRTDQINDYVEERIGEVIKTLNELQGVTDFRLMNGTEVECFVRGFHKHNLLNPEEYDADIGFRH